MVVFPFVPEETPDNYSAGQMVSAPDLAEVG